MKDFGYDLLLTALGVAFAKALDELVEVIKKKASERPTKNDKEA